MSSRGRGRGGFSSSRGNTRFTGKRSGFRGGRGGAASGGGDRPAPVRGDDGTAAAERFEEVKIYDDVDAKLGFDKFESNLAAGESRDGWLVNMHQTLLASESHATGLSAVDYYFIQDDGSMFKATIAHEPYFYVTCRVSPRPEQTSADKQGGSETIVEEWLLKRFEGLVVRVQREKKWDLSVVSIFTCSHI
jgi:DNA polymerase epsilon subunit 1